MFFRTTRDLIGCWVFKATVGGQREQACFVTVGVTKRVRNISIISYSTILNGGRVPRVYYQMRERIGAFNTIAGFAISLLV